MSHEIGAPETEQLPPLYQRWVEEMLPGGIPREHAATCMNCAMCPRPGEAPDPALDQFNPASKCCTYFPSLPNYLVGAALKVDSAGGMALREFVERAGDDRAQVDLCGVIPNGKYRAIYEKLSDDVFGRDASLLCPYAVNPSAASGPLCGIWQHRNAACSTYFCKTVRGHTGDTFWVALRNLMISVERALTWWCIGQLVADPGRVVAVDAVRDRHNTNLALTESAWRMWPGSPAAFYHACAEKVAGLTWREVREIAGAETRSYETAVLARYRHLMTTEVPGRLRAKPIRVVRPGGELYVLQGDPPGEIFELPAAVVQILPYFNGRSTRDILEDIQRDHRIEIDHGLLRRLCDFCVLEEVDLS